MNRHTIRLGRILGIPVDLDYSWFLIFVLLTWTMAVGYYPAEFKDWPAAEYWVVGAATAIMLFVSVLLHELGHAAVAIHYKIPVRSITLLIFGGISQIDAEPPTAAAQFWISLGLTTYLAYINVGLGLFNLIPGFPLDGGGVLRSIVWRITHSMRRATLIAANVGRFIAYLFIVFGVWQILVGNLLNGIWIAFIGWFLESAARGQTQQLALQDLLAGRRVSQAMNRHYVTVPDDTSLQHLVDDHILGSGRRSFVVKRGDRAVGLLTLHHVRDIPRSEWATTTTAQAMIPIEQTKRVQPDAELWAALKEMDRDGVNQLPVTVDGQLQGMLSREDVINYLHTLQELGAAAGRR
jgi:Zn-dependent protease/CBS domain-containing protein